MMTPRRSPPFLLVFVAATAASSLSSVDCAAPQQQPSVATGKELYGTYCALCHGAAGEGYRADEATALANATFLSLATDTYLSRAISNGRPGTTMSAWGSANGGPIDPAGVTAIVGYLRTLAPHAPEETTGPVEAGNASAGEATYGARCATCHGARGEGGRYVKLGNPELLAGASDRFLYRSIQLGRPGTPMPAYDGTLSPKETSDLVAAIRGWQRPPDGPLPMPPRPGDLKGVVLNPDGTDADIVFPYYVPADVVRLALEQGRRLVLLDARPPGDYSRAHISGAVSVPFYEVGAYAAQLPLDVPVVAYCGCPHAESGVAADKLRSLGNRRAYVLDEGFGVWRTRGYPVRGGPNP